MFNHKVDEGFTKETKGNSKDLFFCILQAMQRTICLIFLLLISVAARMDINSEYSVPLAASTICSGDFDLDGDIDLVISHRFNMQTNWGGISFLKNSGDGNFNLDDSLYIAAGNHVTVGQFDENYCPDVFFTAYYSQTAHIGILFNGSHKDSMFINTSLTDGVNYLSSGDIDNNGLEDIVFASTNGQSWGVIYNYGNRQFSLPKLYSTVGFYPSGLACGDLNGDNREDVVICGQSTVVYFNYADSIRSSVLESFDYKDGIWIDDFDMDGKFDILTFVGNPFSKSTTLVTYRNEGNNVFNRLTDLNFPSLFDKFFLSDFDHNGFVDVLFQLSDNSGHIIYKNSNGVLKLEDSIFVSVESYGEPWRDCICADLDGNGFSDIVTIRTSLNHLPANLEIKFNDGNGHFVDHPLGMNDSPGDLSASSFRNYPNPFFNTTTVSFFLVEESLTDLSIYDMQGRFIRRLEDKKSNAGYHQLRWDQRDENGIVCNAGIYFALLKTNQAGSRTIKLVISHQD